MVGPGASSAPSSPSQHASTVVTLGLCTWYITVSAGLINFNKFIMNKDHFPFAIALTTGHVTVTLVSMSLLYLVKPSFFPSMTVAMSKKSELYRFFGPVSLLFIVGVVCSNQAYLYCSVAFLQFMKEWNVALVFMFSCIAGSQTCDRVKLSVIVWIVLAACMAVTGDMKFSHLGFLIQVASQMGETLRIVIQEWLLSGHEMRLDPLTYQIFVGPPTLCALLIANYFFWDPAIIPAFHAWWPYLLANALCAVVLNVTIAVLIKNAGGVAFVLAGVVKDVAIVSSSSAIAGKVLNSHQLSGFVLALLGIVYWGMLKAAPKHPLVALLPKLLGAADTKFDKSSKENLEEQVPLIASSKIGKV